MPTDRTRVPFFVHPQGLCESPNVGEDTRVWAFAHVLGGARIGRDCNICDHVFVENDVIIGDRVTVKCGVQLWDGLRVADDVFIGPNVTFSNDKYPKSKQYQPEVMQTHIGAGASIGAGGTVLPGREVRGEHAHRNCHQFLVCARGSVTVVVDDGVLSEEVVLDGPDIGLYVPPMIWATQYQYSTDALLLVLASAPYDPDDYIRDYLVFKAAVRR